MSKFAFMIHPLDITDYTRKFPLLGKMPEQLISNVTKLFPPLHVSDIEGVVSPHAETSGWFVGCPLTSQQMLSLPQDYVLKKIIKTGRLAEKLGADILGLGAMTSVVGDAGITVNRELDIAVTTGNSYTVAVACQAVKKASELMEVDLKNAEILVLGATGSIGAVCAQILAQDAKYMTVAGRNKAKLERLAHRVFYQTGLSVRIATDVRTALKRADIIIAVTAAVDELIFPEDLKPGAIVCDVARPRDVSKRVAAERDDVLVIEGGVVQVPGPANFNFNFGYPTGMAYACMAETMILALEGRRESYSLGRELSIERVTEIAALADKHKFKLAGFRSFDRPVDNQEIGQICDRAKKKKAG
ncbi:shikimate dehydrogenase [Metallumcola ferriviriculae]|uniref:Shikimate dehydrogenase n=1 Tax=Metallumcola ferriviriculae TaxID=3039180 RepID=A0AAU0UGP0_9FIRM|nr:shikimate dehydrogenase [Desulfitibacteraceae bacterium MK1]